MKTGDMFVLGEQKRNNRRIRGVVLPNGEALFVAEKEHPMLTRGNIPNGARPTNVVDMPESVGMVLTAVKMATSQ